MTREEVNERFRKELSKPRGANPKGMGWCVRILQERLTYTGRETLERRVEMLEECLTDLLAIVEREVR